MKDVNSLRDLHHSSSSVGFIDAIFTRDILLDTYDPSFD